MLEDLLEVVEDVVVGGGRITHNEVLRAHLGNLGNGGLVDFGVESGDEISVVHEEYLFTIDFLFLNLCGKFDVEFRHNLEKEVKRSAVALDVVNSVEQVSFVEVFGSVEHILHIRRIEFEHTEASVDRRNIALRCFP